MKPRTIRLLLWGIGSVIFAGSATPASAYWQFVALGDHGERKVYTRFKTEQECIAVLKSTEAELKKAYPNRFPLVGSCEEYR